MQAILRIERHREGFVFFANARSLSRGNRRACVWPWTRLIRMSTSKLTWNKISSQASKPFHAFEKGVRHGRQSETSSHTRSHLCILYDEQFVWENRKRKIKMLKKTNKHHTDQRHNEQWIFSVSDSKLFVTKALQVPPIILLLNFSINFLPL